jgi:hypothetical protein
MEAQPDFRELLALLNAHDVEYAIVGGYALAFHGAPRATGDMDILVASTALNAERVMAALEAFGVGGIGITATDFQAPDQVIQIGVPPIRIDLITSLTGVTNEDVFADLVHGSYGGTPIRYIGRTSFLKTKRAVGRAKDLADIEALEGC